MDAEPKEVVVMDGGIGARAYQIAVKKYVDQWISPYVQKMLEKSMRPETTDAFFEAPKVHVVMALLRAIGVLSASVERNGDKMATKSGQSQIAELQSYALVMRQQLGVMQEDLPRANKLAGCVVLHLYNIRSVPTKLVGDVCGEDAYLFYRTMLYGAMVLAEQSVGNIFPLERIIYGCKPDEFVLFRKGRQVE